MTSIRSTIQKGNMRTLSVSDVQGLLLDMMCIVTAVFDRNGIQYFLSFGTLLGAVRHSGFIPWDDDVDIHILDDDFDRALRLLEDELPKDYRVLRAEMCPLPWDIDARLEDTRTILVGSVEVSVSDGLSVDFFRAKRANATSAAVYNLYRKFRASYQVNSKIRRKLWWLLLGGIGCRFIGLFSNLLDVILSRPQVMVSDRFYPELYPPQTIFPVKRARFQDQYFPIPRGYDEVLTKQYGNYHQIPEADQQTKHFTFCVWRGD